MTIMAVAYGGVCLRRGVLSEGSARLRQEPGCKHTRLGRVRIPPHQPQQWRVRNALPQDGKLLGRAMQGGDPNPNF